jgi:hypothetical protein
MVGDNLQTILENAQAKVEKDGFTVLPEGTTATLYLSHNGVGLTISRVNAIKAERGTLQARTAKHETFMLEPGDLFAIALEGAQGGPPARRAGFG